MSTNYNWQSRQVFFRSDRLFLARGFGDVSLKRGDVTVAIALSTRIDIMDFLFIPFGRSMICLKGVRRGKLDLLHADSSPAEWREAVKEKGVFFYRLPSRILFPCIDMAWRSEWPIVNMDKGERDEYRTKDRRDYRDPERTQVI